MDDIPVPFLLHDLERFMGKSHSGDIMDRDHIFPFLDILSEEIAVDAETGAVDEHFQILRFPDLRFELFHLLDISEIQKHSRDLDRIHDLEIFDEGSHLGLILGD